MTDDEERFSALYRRYYPEVMRFVARRTEPDGARDVVSETFLTAWRRYKDLPEDPEQVLPWLYKTAANTLANERRGLRRRLRLGARLTTTARSAEADHSAEVAESLSIREALGSLSKRDQETLQLIAWDGLNIAAAAAIAGCSPKTFAVRLHRARQRLDRALESRPERRSLEAKGAHR